MCKKLEPTFNGYSIIHKETWKKFYTIWDLIESQWCLMCIERFQCKLVQIMEWKKYKQRS